MAGRKQQEGRHIPANFRDASLNLRAFIDLPPGVTPFSEAIDAVLERLLAKRISPEEAKTAIVRLNGEELDRLQDAVTDALAGGKPLSAGEIYAEGVKEDLRG